MNKLAASKVAYVDTYNVKEAVRVTTAFIWSTAIDTYNVILDFIRQKDPKN